MIIWAFQKVREQHGQSLCKALPCMAHVRVAPGDQSNYEPGVNSTLALPGCALFSHINQPLSTSSGMQAGPGHTDHPLSPSSGVHAGWAWLQRSRTLGTSSGMQAGLRYHFYRFLST
jgi:hypothetical protein